MGLRFAQWRQFCGLTMYIIGYIGQIRKHLWRGPGLVDEGLFFSVRTAFYLGHKNTGALKGT